MNRDDYMSCLTSELNRKVYNLLLPMFTPIQVSIHSYRSHLGSDY